MEMTLMEFINLLSLLPNPLLSYSKNIELCTLTVPTRQDNIDRIRIMHDYNNSSLSKEEVFYNNSTEIQFKLNLHDNQIPFWEPINPITIRRYNSFKEKKMKDEGTYRFPYKP